jgi:sugar lactone lactonase YvrE
MSGCATQRYTSHPLQPLARGRRRLRMLRLSAAFLVLALLSLTACAAPVSVYQSEPAVKLQWPEQTTGPKIVWVRTIAGYQDAGITKGFWKRTLEFFTGADERRIVRPYGVLCDEAERLYIADPGGGVVHSMDIKEGRYTVIGGDADSPLRTPIGLTEDESGHLYITDSTAGAVFRVDLRDGALKKFLDRGLRRPTGITYNRVNKLLYIVDTTSSQVVAIDMQGKERIRFGAPGEGPGQFNRPTDIAVDKRGQVYVTDPLNYKIKVFTPEGLPVTQFGVAGDSPGEMDKPKGVAVDSEGHIYVCDALLDAIQIFDDSGRHLLTFGVTGTDNGQFWMPSGIFIDRHDYIFVADTYNRRVQVFRYIAGAAGNNPRGSK